MAPEVDLLGDLLDLGDPTPAATSPSGGAAPGQGDMLDLLGTCAIAVERDTTTLVVVFK